MKQSLFLAAAAACLLTACNGTATQDAACELERAKATLDTIYARYGVPENCLLRENYPFNADYKAGYLASEDQARPNPYSYLWPFSGTLSAASAILESDSSYRTVVDERVLPGLAEYLDTVRMPAAYSSYIHSAPASDRFYDDNVWLGIDFCDLYATTGDERYLESARMIWRFIESGMDDVLGGGIYWCEQKKHSKNTCSNAPGTVYALKLYAPRQRTRTTSSRARPSMHGRASGWRIPPTASISTTCRSTATSPGRSTPTTADRWSRPACCSTRLRARSTS